MEKTKVKSKKKVEVSSRCEKCGKKFYSKTTNKDGKIICPNCDRDFGPKHY